MYSIGHCTALLDEVDWQKLSQFKLLFSGGTGFFAVGCRVLLQ